MSTSTSGSITSSDLAKGKKFIKKLLYVQHVDEEKDTASEIPDRYLEEFLIADRTNFADSKFTGYLKSPKENLSILKISMGGLNQDWIEEVTIYSNPLPTRLQLKDVTIHAFVVFETERFSYSNDWNGHLTKTWWSLEKNGLHIVLQQSPNKDDVINKIYDTETKTSVERLGPIKKEISAHGVLHGVRGLMRIIVDANMLNERYNLVTSNCQHFTSFIFEKLCRGREKWSTMTSAIVDRMGKEKKLKKKKIQPKIKVDAFKYKSILKDDNFDCYWAMMEGRRKDFEEMTNNLTIECLNSVDSQGYTLLEWATVFSSSDWPIDEDLKKKGATIPSNEDGSFRRNVFFIALQYLPPNTKSKFLSFDGIDIDINGVNPTGDTALHLALNGEKWEIAEEILNRFENYDVNLTNSIGDTPLHLAAKLNCEIGLFTKILNRTNSENVNKTDENGNTALHYAIIHLFGYGWTAPHHAIDTESEPAVKELLNREDVNVDIKNKNHKSALHLASTMRKDFPSDLFKLILEKSTDVNAQGEEGLTALHFAILFKFEIATKELLAHNDVNVNVHDKNFTPLHLACSWTDIPMNLFNLILEKSTSDTINAQKKCGNTALHLAITVRSKTATKALLAHSDVIVNVKNNNNETALHLASKWNNIPFDLFKLIKERKANKVKTNRSKLFESFDGIDIHGVANKTGDTALHLALYGGKWELAEEILNRFENYNVNKTNSLGDTPLLLAAKLNNCEIGLFKKILNRTNSENVNAQDRNGNTALHYAIGKKSEPAVKELLNREDVDVDIKNKNHKSALMASTTRKDFPSDLFEIILEKTIDVNAQDEDGDTALYWTILHNSEIMTNALLKHKDVNVNVKTNRNSTALHFASTRNDIPSDLFKLILEKSTDVNAQDNDGNTALHCAIDKKCEIATKELLKHNDVDVNIKNNQNKTALIYASQWKGILIREYIPVDLFKLILEKTTDVNAQDNDGNTALHLALFHKSEIMTKELLNHKDVDVNFKDKNFTPLHLASSWEDIPMDLFKKILEKSTDVNKQDENGCTALHWAIIRQCEIATKALLAHNDVNVNVKTNRNSTALHFASRWKGIPADLFKIILEKLKDVINTKDGNGNTALHLAIDKKCEIATKELLAHNDVDVNVKNNDKETALHLASSKWPNIPSDLFKFILEKSTYVINAQDKDGNTALHVAIYHKSEIATKALLGHSDVDVKVKNNYNETALHLIPASKWKDIPSDLFKLFSERERKANKVKKNSKMDRLFK